MIIYPQKNRAYITWMNITATATPANIWKTNFVSERSISELVCCFLMLISEDAHTSGTRSTTGVWDESLSFSVEQRKFGI